MDAINDYYMEGLNLSDLERFFREEGNRRTLEKQEYFVRQGERADRVAYVEEGMFRLLRTDAKGGEHIVGYSFKGNFVAEYTSCLCGRPALADVQAIVRSTLYPALCQAGTLLGGLPGTPAHGARRGRTAVRHGLPPPAGQLLQHA